MKNILFIFFIVALAACSSKKSKKKERFTEENFVALRTDTVNVVRKTDSLVIFESTCRGCAYEGSTDFEIEDTFGIVKLHDVVTTDNNPDNVSGGSVSKTLILLPQKTGTTIFKLYKFYGDDTRSKDSTLFKAYTLEVKE